MPSFEFRMPSLGSDMEAGTLIEWLIAPGEHVDRGQIVAVVQTQKAAIEVEIFESGVVDELRVMPGEKVPVGTVLATLHGEDAAAKPARTPTPSATPLAPPEGAAEPSPAIPAPMLAEPEPMPPRERGAAQTPAAVATPRLRISPSARQLARELDIDQSTLIGTGHHGAITREDVQRAFLAREPKHEAVPTVAVPAEPVPAEPVPAEAGPAAAVVEDTSAIRQAIAAAMTRSNREIPHYYLATTVDIGRAQHVLHTYNEARPVTDRILLAAFLLKAVARALESVPELNGFFRDGRFEASRAINIGTAISLRGGGVIAPAVCDLASKDLPLLMTELRDLVNRARAGRLRSSELGDATITVTNLGERAPEEVFGVIYPPQVALVGFGGLHKRPWVVGDALAIRETVRVSLSGDHRVSDGHRGAVFLEGLRHHIEDAEEL